MSETVRLLLADDHAMIRQGIRMILESQPDMEVVGEASTGREAIALTATHHPDVVLMDLTMPDLNGMEATIAIKRQHPEVQVLVLTMHDSQEQFFKLLQVGASGYILKGDDKNELLAAVRAVARGGVFLHPTLAKCLVENFVHPGGGAREGASHLRLTDREVEVLRLIAEGRTNREIANSLILSSSTVEHHRENIMAKLGLHSRADLIKYAIRHGIIDLDT